MPSLKRLALKTALMAGVLGAGLKLLHLLLLAHKYNTFVILPYWPNVCDAVFLIMAGLIGLIEVGWEVWLKWWKGRGTGTGG